MQNFYTQNPNLLPACQEEPSVLQNINVSDSQEISQSMQFDNTLPTIPDSDLPYSPNTPVDWPLEQSNSTKSEITLHRKNSQNLEILTAKPFSLAPSRLITPKLPPTLPRKNPPSEFSESSKSVTTGIFNFPSVKEAEVEPVPQPRSRSNTGEVPGVERISEEDFHAPVILTQCHEFAELLEEVGKIGPLHQNRAQDFEENG